jgi:hypothetical protein
MQASVDPEATVSIPFISLGEAGRPVLSQDELLVRLSALIRGCEGCANVVVTGASRLDGPDRGGCNWSASIVLDPRGVAPEVYALAYASVIATARASWNLE